MAAHEVNGVSLNIPSCFRKLLVSGCLGCLCYRMMRGAARGGCRNHRLEMIVFRKKIFL